MIEFKKILFPVDFSEHCIEAAQYFAGIARKFQSELRCSTSISETSMRNARLWNAVRSSNGGTNSTHSGILSPFIKHREISEVVREAALQYHAGLGVIGRGRAAKFLEP